jgi:hypothetical protein
VGEWVFFKLFVNKDPVRYSQTPATFFSALTFFTCINLKRPIKRAEPDDARDKENYRDHAENNRRDTGNLVGKVQYNYHRYQNSTYDPVNSTHVFLQCLPPGLQNFLERMNAIYKTCNNTYTYKTGDHNL